MTAAGGPDAVVALYDVDPERFRTARRVVQSFGSGDAHPEVDRWDGPFVELPDRAAVTEYLQGRGIDAEVAERVGDAVDVPLTVTKRGCVVYAHVGS